MRKAGICEARQHLTALLDEVKKGREVVITDRGRPVARLVAPARPMGQGLPNLAAFRSAVHPVRPTLSSVIATGRDDRF